MQRTAIAIALLAAAALAWARPHMLDVGTQAPNVNLPLFGNAGRHVSLDSLRGKVVLLDFWASWCLPCVHNLPKLQEYATAFKDKPFRVIGVHYDATDFKQNIALYLRDQGVLFPVAIDSGETFKRFAITRLPTYVLIGKNGEIAAQSSEPPSREAIAALLDDASQ